MNTISIQFGCEGIDWEHLAQIFASAFYVERKPWELKQACENSYLCCFAFDGEVLVGTARATSDGVYYATIFDVVVAAEYQGKGVGKALMQALLVKLPFEKIFLTAVAGKEGFYQKLGFLKHNRSMGLYQDPQRAIELGILS